MVKFYRHVSALALLCLMGCCTNVFGQQFSAATTLKLSINSKLPGEPTYERTKLMGQKAVDLNVTEFLENNHGMDIMISGSQFSETEKITYRFDSKKLVNPENCTSYCETVVSLDKVPFLGVSMVVMDDFDGVLVNRIVNKTAAQKARLQKDDIITYINGIEMRSSCALKSFVLSSNIGDELDIKIKRDEREMLVKAILGERIAKVVSWKPCCEEDVKEPISNTATTSTDWASQLKTFPNPSGGLSQLEYTSDSKEPLNILVTDVSGREIYRQQVNNFDGYYQEYLDLNDQNSGIYFLNIIQGNQNKRAKIVLQKQ